ncbi:PREDICTED: astacin-like metalloendopeptidase [Acropora digitifera]|uniref:astacin-like metalloendopeptidase n=1 Tax=Acropora digitifera TaxID=70779 RepID=UPI00077A6F95|nr:PREDICTED: astacin-like metalloendopeptidase [Acropora digitifera]
MLRISFVRFQPRTSEQYYIRFIRSTGCWSYIGKVRVSGGQSISIGDRCDTVGTVLHELMHALGFFHTSSRYDRDSYVIVRSENIRKGKWLRFDVINWNQDASHDLHPFPLQTGYELNFHKYTHAQIDLLKAPYDMTSLMHPPRYAFSKNGLNTIEARAGSHVSLGNIINISKIDKAQVNLLYGCTGYSSCYRAFGMETFHIPDSQITASSYKKYHEPAQARLHMAASASGNGAWCASQSYQQGEWLQETCMTSFPFLLTFQERIRPPYLQQYQVMIGRWRGVGYCGDEFHSTAADLCPVPIIKVVLKFGQFHAQLHPRSFTSNSREERESGFDGVTGRHELRNKFLCWTQAMLLHCVGRSRRKENSDRDCHTRKAGLLRQRMDYTPRCFGKFRSGQLVSSIWWKG